MPLTAKEAKVLFSPEFQEDIIQGGPADDGDPESSEVAVGMVHMQHKVTS